MCEKICIEWEREWYTYSNRIGIRRAKIKEEEGIEEETLRLRVVERWKGKRKIMVGSSGEK